jgi:hypothetical protein
LKATFKDNEDLDRDSSESPPADTDNQDSEASEVLIGEQNSISREQLLQSVPSKEISELMLWNFFNSSNPTLGKTDNPL